MIDRELEEAGDVARWYREHWAPGAAEKAELDKAHVAIMRALYRLAPPEWWCVPAVALPVVGAPAGLVYLPSTPKHDFSDVAPRYRSLFNPSIFITPIRTLFITRGGEALP